VYSTEQMALRRWTTINNMDNRTIVLIE